MLCRLATLKYDHELHGFPEETLRAAQAAGSLLEVRERWFEQGGVQHVALLLLFDEAGVAVATTRRAFFGPPVKGPQRTGSSSSYCGLIGFCLVKTP